MHCLLCCACFTGSLCSCTHKSLISSQCSCLIDINKTQGGHSDTKSLSKITFGNKTGFFQLVDQNANVLQSIHVASVLFIPIFIPTKTGERLRNSRRLHWELLV